MTWSDRIRARIERLRSHADIAIAQSAIHAGLSHARIDAMAKRAGRSLPTVLSALYADMDGATVIWSSAALAGSINIVPLQQALFGFAPRRRYEDAFKDVLWNDGYDGAAIREMRQHRVLESVAGDPTFITFKPQLDCPLFRVHEEDFAPLRASLDEYLEQIVLYAGADGLRERLTQHDWRTGVAADASLRRAAAL